MDNEEPASFESSLAALETIVHDLEDGQLGLTEALARYERGVKHLKHCHELLAAAEQKIELLTGVAADGSAQTEALDQPTEPLAESAGRRRRTRPAKSAGTPGSSSACSGDVAPT